MSVWLADAALATLLFTSSGSALHVRYHDAASSWQQIGGPPVDPCMGPLYAIHVQPHVTLTATSADRRIYWSVMVGDRGIEAAACSADHTELEALSGDVKGNLSRAAFSALYRATQELVSESSLGLTPIEVKHYLAETELLQVDLHAKLALLIAAERRHNPKFPRNTPVISIPVP